MTTKFYAFLHGDDEQQAAVSAWSQEGDDLAVEAARMSTVLFPYYSDVDPLLVVTLAELVRNGQMTRAGALVHACVVTRRVRLCHVLS